ncbi:outer membrane protein assembly factor BamB family protein [Streptomyces marincola]|uniref:outer membrane protein assembly factor BamB family protein n=1 Tax=Streptomyces marincola TaxID=2878388 RepID=UPI001CF17A0A|nr:PQQ-binding-like beta-propeller repeat protein [Streptomyces marincola]UCM87507.1 PQQ-binding-like beta-propeller repeat protein [Streptomyces marincola]
MVAGLEADDPRQVGRYRMVARLGAGGMGRVYLGRSPGGRDVAVKVVRAELAEDPGFRQRFAREVAAARRVTGVFTASVVDADPEGSPAWLATEYVPGMSLGQAVAGLGPWPEPAVLALGAGLVEALEAIHGAGVVHRDLKPSNVLLAPDGPRVIDFGISVTDELGALTRTGTVVGTPGFMAPEQLTTNGRPGPASDVFALGAVLAFAATGSGPFGSGAPHTLHYRTVHEEPDLSRLPPVLGAVVAGCLAKTPEERPELAALLQELSRAFEDEAGQAPGPRSAYGWLPGPVALALREERAGGDRGAGEGGLPDAPTTTGAAPGTSAPAHPPTVIGAPVSPPPAPRTPPAPATAPPRSRTRRQVLVAAAGAVGAGGIALAGWRLLGGDGDEAPGDSSGPGPGGGAPGPDAESGTERWSLTDLVALDAVTVADGVVYVSTAEGVEGRVAGLHALDAADGGTRWTFPLDATLVRPAVADGTVWVTARSDRLYALDAEDGRLRWTYEGNDTPASTPTVVGDTVYVCSGEGRLYALDAASGERRWLYTYPWEGGLSAPSAPTVADGAVYVGDGDGALHAVDAATGSGRWTHPSESGHRVFPPAAVADGTAYFSSSNGIVYAVDTAGGERRWSFRASEYQPSGPVLADGTVYAHDFRENLYALDAASGEQRWASPLGGDVVFDPAVSDGTVCFVTENVLRAVDARTGRALWSFDILAESEIRTPPVIADRTVYFAINDVYHEEHFVLYAVAL